MIKNATVIKPENNKVTIELTLTGEQLKAIYGHLMPFSEEYPAMAELIDLIRASVKAGCKKAVRAKNKA